MEHPWVWQQQCHAWLGVARGCLPVKCTAKPCALQKTCSLHGAEPCAGCPLVTAQVGAQCISTHPAGGLPPSPGAPGQGARGQQGLELRDRSWILSQPGELREGGTRTPLPSVADLGLRAPSLGAAGGATGAPGQSSQVPRAQHFCPRALSLPPELLQVVAFGGEKWGDSMRWGVRYFAARFPWRAWLLGAHHDLDWWCLGARITHGVKTLRAGARAEHGEPRLDKKQTQPRQPRGGRWGLSHGLCSTCPSHLIHQA